MQGMPYRLGAYHFSVLDVLNSSFRRSPYIVLGRMSTWRRPCLRGTIVSRLLVP